MRKIVRLTESDLVRIVNRVIKESLDDNSKDNPRTIVVKFEGDKFLDRYINMDEYLNRDMVWYNSWWDLNHDGLEMTDGVYYALYKDYRNFGPEEMEKYHKGRGIGPNYFFLTYHKLEGEITIWSSGEYDLDPGKSYKFSELKNPKYYTYFSLEGPNGESRLVTTGSRDHRGYFKIIDTKN